MTDPQYSVQEFAQAIRTKYPGAYDKIDDNSLTSAWLEKYPAYRPQVKTAPVQLPSNIQTPEPAPKLLSWEGLNTPIADLWTGHRGMMSDAITSTLTGFKTTQEMRDAANAVPAKNPSHAPSYTERVAGNMAAGGNDLAASFTSPLSVATFGLSKLFSATRAATAAKSATLENSIAMSQALRAGGGDATAMRQAASDIMNARQQLESATRVYKGIRAASVGTSVAFAAQGATQAATGDTLEDRLQGAATGVLGLVGTVHSAHPVPRSPAGPVDPAEFTRRLASTQGLEPQTPDTQIRSDEAYGRAAAENLRQAKRLRIPAQAAKETPPTMAQQPLSDRPGSPVNKAMSEAEAKLAAKQTFTTDPRTGEQILEDQQKFTPVTGQGKVSEQVKASEPGLSGAEVSKPQEPVDLREMSSEDRHNWINKNVHFAADSAEGAQSQAQKLFGRAPDKVTAYIDKSGETKYGYTMSPEAPKVGAQPTVMDDQAAWVAARKEYIQQFPDKHPNTNEAISWISKRSLELKQVPVQSGGTSVPTAPITEHEEPIVTKIRDLENQFTQAMPRHAGLLDSLMNKVDEFIPKDSPRQTRLQLYHDALTKMVDAAGKNDLIGMMDAFNKAGQRGQGGFIKVVGRTYLNPADIDRIVKAHADTMLTKMESLSDENLRAANSLKRLTDPSLRSAVYGANDPILENRYEELVSKAAKGRAVDVLTQLSQSVLGRSLDAGDITRGVMRENLAVGQHNSDVRLNQLDSYIKDWDNRPLKDNLAFIDAIEHGDLNAIVDPQDRQVAGTLRDLLDAKRDEIRGLGTGVLDKFYQNYFPHLWKMGAVDMAKQIMQGRRPFGPTSFLKPRVYSTITEGIANGMEPVTYNPVKMAVLKLQQMDRYLTAHKTFEELKARGVVQEFKTNAVPPDFSPLDDNMFRSSEGKQWYAPDKAATVINNHLSPSRLQGLPVYNSIRAYNNVINQFNLGLSAFHGVETAVNSMVTRGGLGIGQMFEGLKAAAKGDISGAAYKGAVGALKLTTAPFAPFDNYLVGNRLLQEHMEPGRFADMTQMSNLLDAAGGRVQMGSDFKNMARESFRNAWQDMKAAPSIGRGATLATRAIGAGLEKMSAPLMENFVPRIKLGAFADLAEDTMNKLPSDAPRELIRHELSKVWDSIDNRFGQVVYDNLFWNRLGKDLSHLMVRSVGWNLGTFRELAGGLWDVKDLATQGKLSTRTAYTMSLLGASYLMARIGATIYGQEPDQNIYAGYFKTGKVNPDGTPEYVGVKTYLNDAMGFVHQPGTTLVNKGAPWIHQVMELYNNADYYGNQIAPIHSGTIDAMKDPATYTSVGKYLVTGGEPFSVRNYQQRRLMGNSVPSSLASGFAVLPAPKWIGQSPAASLAFNLYRTQLPRGPNDPEQAAKLQAYHQLASGYAANLFTDKDVDRAYNSGHITLDQYNGILGEGDGKLSPLQRHTKLLQPSQFLRVFDAASIDERQSLADQFYQKWDRALENLPEDEANKVSHEFEIREKLLRRPETPKPLPNPDIDKDGKVTPLTSAPTIKGTQVNTLEDAYKVFDGRPLSKSELSAVAPIFKNHLDLGHIQVHEIPTDVLDYVTYAKGGNSLGAAVKDRPNDIAIAKGTNWALLSKFHSEEGTIGHELTHDYQYQGGASAGDTTSGQNMYFYGTADDMQKDWKQGKRFKDFSNEQQARMVEDYIYLNQQGPGGLSDARADHLRALSPFIKDLQSNGNKLAAR